MSTDASVAAGLAASNVAFQLGFQEAFIGGKSPGAHQFYVDESPTTAEVTTKSMLANYPMMREWVGARREKYMRSYSQSITLKSYEVTMRVRRKDLQYGDQLGAIAKAMQDWMAMQAKSMDKSAYTSYMSNSGAGPTGYDSVALFATTHPHSGSGGNQSNLSAATNLSAKALDAAASTMGSLTLENNEPAEYYPTHLLVGPSLERRAKALLGSATRVVTVDASGVLDATSSAVAAATGPNVFDGEFTLIVDKRRVGTPAYYWDLLDLSRPGIRPMIRLVGEAIHPVHQNQPTDPQRFNQDSFVYGLEGDWIDDCGFWMCAHRGTGTA